MDFGPQITEAAAKLYANRPALSYTEAGDLLTAVTGVKVSAGSIKLLVKQGRLNTVKVSTHILVPVEALKALKFEAPAARPAPAKKQGRKPAEAAK